MVPIRAVPVGLMVKTIKTSRAGAFKKLTRKTLQPYIPTCARIWTTKESAMLGKIHYRTPVLSAVGLLIDNGFSVSLALMKGALQGSHGS